MSLEASLSGTSVAFYAGDKVPQPCEIFIVTTHRHLFDIHLYHSAKLTMSRSSEAYKMQASTGPLENRDEEDHDEQVWKDVKAETGFSSYTEYVKTLVKSGRHFESLLRYKKLADYRDFVGEISVLDIQKDGSMVTSFNAGRSESQLQNPRKINTRLLRNLRSPPEAIPLRIVLWSIPRGTFPNASITEVLGSGLYLDPTFFRDLPYYSTKPPSTRSHQVIIGDSIATVARDYRRDGNVPPVLVIAGCIDLHSRFSYEDNELDKRFSWIFDEVMSEEISGGTSVLRSTIDKGPPNDLESVPSNYYHKLLGKYLHKENNVGSEDDALLLIAMLPLLRLEILRLRGQCSLIASVLNLLQFEVENPGFRTEERKDKHYTMLDKHRFWLRRRLEGLQESKDHFPNFARSQNAANWLASKIWLGQDADIRDALAMARTKELEVRDYMQLQIGNLSISESRKSIHLSNQQMNEAKGGKKSILSYSIVCAN